MKVIGIDKNGDEIAEVSVTELDTMFKEIRSKAVDDFLEKICEKYTEEEGKGNYKQYCASIKQEIADIAAEMRGAE